MKISEYIIALQAVLAEHGDLMVLHVDDFSGHPSEPNLASVEEVIPHPDRDCMGLWVLRSRVGGRLDRTRPGWIEPYQTIAENSKPTPALLLRGE